MEDMQDVLLPVVPTLALGKLDRPMNYGFFRRSNFLTIRAAARLHVERICTEARFDSYDQCAQVMGYVGIIVSACDPRSRTFRDPIPLMRRQLARVEADTSMPAADKERTITEMKQTIAAFPDRLPEEHIRLMTATAIASSRSSSRRWSSMIGAETRLTGPPHSFRFMNR